MADLPKPSDLLGKKLPKPQDLLKKKEVTQPVSGIGGQTSKLGFEPFQDQVPTKTPSVLTTKGATEYKEQVKDYKPPVQKTASKPKTLTEAVSNDDSYIGALWNQIPGAVSDFVGGLSKIAGKGAAQMYGKPIQSLVDVVNKAGGQNIVNPIDQFATDENIEKVGKVGEKAVKKLRTSASSEEYEKSIQEGFDITDGIGFADIKAVPIMLSRLVADAGLSIPTGGLSFVAQGYNQGLNEYDEAVKGIPKELRTDNAREGFAVIYGTINGLADKLGLDLITKSKPVSETVKKFILKEAVQELAKKEVKNLTSEAIEKTISSIAQKTFNKVKSVGVKTVIGAGVESVTESIQGGLSDGLKVLTNKLSDSNIFDVDEIKKNFWKSRINDAAGGFVLGGALGGAMNSLRSTDSYISERVAESTTPEQIQQLKEELANSVDDQGNPLLDEERIDILNQAIDKYSESNQKLPAGLSTQKRAKVLQLMSERDSIKELIGSASQELNNIDEAVRPESEKDLIILQNKEQQKNDEIREAVSGNKYKYYQDEDGKFFKKIGNESPTEITEDYFNLQNQDSEIKQPKPTTAQPIQEPTVDAKKAEIEKRRQEEINSITDEVDGMTKKQQDETAGDRISRRVAANAKYDAELTALEQQTKLKEDAIQVETAGQVPVQPEAPVSEEVEQGRPEAKPEVVTEKGKEVDKSIDFSSAFKDAGEQISNALYNQVFDALKKGENKISGVNEPLIAQMKPLYDKGEIKSAEDIARFVEEGFRLDSELNVLEEGKEEVVLTKIVEQLRADEQAELKAALPNADQYLTDGKVDEKKLTNDKDKEAFNEIWERYNVLITPPLKEAKKLAAPKQEAPAKAEPKLKPRVETRIKFAKAIELFNDISATKGGAKKRTLSAKRKLFLEQNPSIKYIDDNWRKISKQLEDKGLLKKEGNCP